MSNHDRSPDDSRYEAVHYPGDEILLRVTDRGNVQVVEYFSTDRDGPPAHYHPWHEIEVVIEGEVEFYRHSQWIRGGPGTVQMLPAGVAHSARVPEGLARLLYVTIGPPTTAWPAGWPRCTRRARLTPPASSPSPTGTACAWKATLRATGDGRKPCATFVRFLLSFRLTR